MDSGEQLLNIVTAVNGGKNITGNDDKTWDHHMSRAAGRLLEETTELALAYGLKPGQIHMHVSDAIANEARKQWKESGHFHFPSEVNVDTSFDEKKVELGDVSLLIDYIRHITGFSPTDIEDAKKEKLDKLEMCLRKDELVLVDGLLYRAISRGA